MKKSLLLAIAIASSLFFIISCKKDSPDNNTNTTDCSGVNIAINAIPTAVIPCPSTLGSITVNATGSTGFTYNKNGGAYQSSNLFSSLTAGTYSIGVKDVNGCTNTATVTVGTAAAGPLFTAVKNNIIVPSCVSCHGNSGGCNLNSDCNIVSYANKIKARCVDANPGPMPQSGLLSANLRTQITNWVNAGGRYTD